MKKILVIDYDREVLSTLSGVLSDRDTAVIGSTMMEEAEAALSRYPFDLVIADIRVSGMVGREGLELLSYVKGINRNTEVIVLDGTASDEIRRDAAMRGAFAYYEKPFNTSQLKSRVALLGIGPSATAGEAADAREGELINA